MDPRIQLLCTGARAEDARRVAALIERCDLPEATTKTALLAAAAATLSGGGFDAVVAACPADPGELDPILGDALSAILLAPRFTATLAELAHRSGALVCLEEHGPAPLRSAILRAAQARRHEDAIRASEQVFALVNRSVADVVFSLAVEGDRYRFLAVNPMFTRATGLGEEKVVGKLIDEVIPEPSLSMVVAHYRQAIAEGHTVHWDEVTDYPTGKKYGEVSITPVIDAAGRCSRLVGTVHDVTEERMQAETIRLYAEIVRAVQIGLTVWNVADPDDPGAVRLAGFNPEAARASGLDLVPSVGKTLLELLPDAEGTELLALISSVARQRTVQTLRDFRFSLGPLRGRAFAVNGFPIGGERVGLAFEEVTEQARARALTVAERLALEMAAEGASLESTLTALVLAVEEQAPPAVASVLLVSEEGTRLLPGAAPNLPAEYSRGLNGLAIGPRAGSCGTAAALRRAVIVGDILDDPLWADYRELAALSGMRACWSTPILTSDGRVLGTFAVYYRHPRFPAPGELDLIGRVSHVAAIVIQRHELDAQLRGLSSRLEAAREEERTGIAREIHDQLGQTITALKLDLAWIARRATSADGLAPLALADKIAALLHLTDEMISQVRRISAELRPGILDDVGLSAALSWQAQDFEERTHIACDVRSELADERQLSHPVATTVFRVFQEALTNVVRHAEASRVGARLYQDGATLVLEVTDDGKGIATERLLDPRSLGLLGIRERARRLGGSASFARAEPAGTVVTLQLPVG